MTALLNSGNLGLSYAYVSERQDETLSVLARTCDLTLRWSVIARIVSIVCTVKGEERQEFQHPSNPLCWLVAGWPGRGFPHGSTVHAPHGPTVPSWSLLKESFPHIPQCPESGQSSLVPYWTVFQCTWCAGVGRNYRFVLLMPINNVMKASHVKKARTLQTALMHT